MFINAVLCIALIYGALRLFKLYLNSLWKKPDVNNEVSIDGKLVIITGASSGIGKGAAYEFAKRHAKVILACRDLAKAKQAVNWIRERTGNGELICMELDLANLESVRKFADEVKKKYDRISVLVNNAGVMLDVNDRRKTSDGFEIHFGVNHLGHFLLTNLLLESLKNGAPSRIVNVSSIAHNHGLIDFDDLNSEKSVQSRMRLKMFALYANSKLCNVLFNLELSKRLSGTGVRSYALCPGAVDTEIWRNMKGGRLEFLFCLLRPILVNFIFRTEIQGAATIIFCALDKSVMNETGQRYKNCRAWKPKDRVELKDDDAKRLWEESENLIKDYLN